ncbi:MAG: hypothetical protein ACJ8CB_03740 [Ktedonobacteraceae bacterium]
MADAEDWGCGVVGNGAVGDAHRAAFAGDVEAAGDVSRVVGEGAVADAQRGAVADEAAANAAVVDVREGGHVVGEGAVADAQCAAVAGEAATRMG